MRRVGVERDAALARDAALRRIRLTRGWMVAAAAALTAGLAALVSAVLPGKSLGAKSRVAIAPARTTSAATPALPPPASAAQLGVGSPSGQSEQVSPPATAPQPDPQPAPESAPQPAPEPAPQQAAPAPAPAAPSGGGGGVVSGGS
jgi:outer membrane biosynthesis protein TonB